MDTSRDYQYHRTLTEEVKEEVVDCGFVEVDSEDVHQLCTACLCATRTTHMLDDDTLKQYYINILSETQLEAGVPVLQSQRLCWECVAHLKRSVRFREQVQDSYRLLQPMLLNCDKEDLSEFLHTSVCRPGRLSTYFAHSIDISPQDDDAQTMTADQHDDDDGAEQLPVLVKDEREDEQLQETETDPRKQVKKKVKSNSANEFDCDLKSTYACEKSFQCEVCQKSFSRKYSLIPHRRTHTSEKPFRCDVCQKSFSQKYNLIVHMTVHTGKKCEKSFQCEVCQKSFSRKHSLILHMTVHTGKKPFQCEVCQKSFSLKNSLRAHIAIHKKLFECKVCQKSFRQKFSLIEHIRLHTGEKPFQCEVCQKSFFKKSCLKIHTLSHNGEKSFQCDVCQKSYAQKHNLIDHIRLHTGEKPFQCEVCQTSFSKKKSLLTHILSHTGAKPFQCEVCQKSYTRKYSLNQHKRLHTG